ncbi:MAG: redoxin domain-containing protein [Pirellulaceae bacterium]
MLTATLLCGASPLLADEEQPPERIGRRIEKFTLRDYRGKEVSLTDYADTPIMVLAFLGTECPLAKLYAPRLVALHKAYSGRGVAFLGVNANVQDSITEVASHARRHELPFPVVKDVGNHLADRLGAVRTPEIFVLDKDRVVRYWGRIDDQYQVGGIIHDEPRRHDLARALDEMLIGWPVSTKVTEACGCHIGRVRPAKTDGEVTFSNQIARIFNRRCVECHREGQIAPFALTEYEEAAGWAEMIDEVVSENRMPPWHAGGKHGVFANDRRLTPEEKQLLHQWFVDGAPEGDRAKLPPPPQFKEGWDLPRAPDVVIPMRRHPFEVSAEGPVNYQYFDIDPGFREDKWIKGIQCRPGNYAVVHHILLFVKHGQNRFDQGEGYLGVYVPGMRSTVFPEGMAKFVPAGSKLLMQVHYAPVGTKQLDLSRVGFVFADPDEVEHGVVSACVGTRSFHIPAGAADHQVKASSAALQSEIQLLSMMPHMHFRGKSFTYELVGKEGKRETLLDVPHYDPNWQTAYLLPAPRRLPIGAQLACKAVFDNSADNLANPNPNVAVDFGPKTSDEMMFGYFDYAVPRELFLRMAGWSKNQRTTPRGR